MPDDHPAPPPSARRKRTSVRRIHYPKRTDQFQLSILLDDAESVKQSREQTSNDDFREKMRKVRESLSTDEFIWLQEGLA